MQSAPHNMPQRQFISSSFFRKIYACHFPFYTLCFAFIFGFSSAQQSGIDSLQNLLQSAADDTSKVDILYRLSEESEYDKDVLAYASQSLRLAERLNYQKGIALASNNVGYAYMNLGDIPKALEFYHRSLKIQEELSVRETNPPAKLESKSGVANSFNNIAYVFENQGDITKALEYFNKSLKIREEINDKEGVAQSLNNIGVIYNKNGDYQGAVGFFQKSLLLYEELKDRNGMGGSFSNIGAIYQKAGDFGKAVEYYQKALAMREEIKDKPGIATTLINMGGVFFTQKNYIKAEEYCTRSLKIAKEIGFPSSIRNASNQLSNIYSVQGKYREAFGMQVLFKQMADSISNEETRRSSVKKQMQYDFEKKEQTLKDIQDKKDAIATAERRKQQIITLSVMVGLVLVAIVLVVVFRTLRITRKQKQIIEIAKDEIAEQKKKVDEKQQEIIDSITYAKSLQEAILPPADLINKHLPESFVLYKPKDIVAGDFYWFFQISDLKSDVLFIAAADCTGHGVPGAMVSVVCSNALNQAVKEIGLRDTGKILDKVTDLILETFSAFDKSSAEGKKRSSDVKDGMDISLLKIEFAPSPENNQKRLPLKIQWSGANNPLWYYQDQVQNNTGGNYSEISANKQPVGKYEIREPFKTHHIEYSGKMVFYLFTDGLPDQFGGEKGKKFMYQRFKKLIYSIHEKPMPEQKQILDMTIEDWKGSLEQIDDICVIGVRV